MATIKNLVNFAAKFFDMAKAKGKSGKKVAPKGNAKPVAKKPAKPVKKAAPAKAKKPAKPAPSKAKTAVKKPKPVAKKTAPIKKVKPANTALKKAVKKVEKPVKKAIAKPVKPVAKAVHHAPAPAKVQANGHHKPLVKPVQASAVKTSAKGAKNNMKGKEDEAGLNLRYSDEELKEFKELLDKKLISAREELKNLKESLENHTESQVGNKAWNMEEGTDTSEMEYLMNQISRQHQYIRNLELAMVRIENKTYGICRVTGKLIPKERLRIVPHATLSLEAKMTRRVEESPAAGAAAAPPSDFSEGFED